MKTFNRTYLFILLVLCSCTTICQGFDSSAKHIQDMVIYNVVIDFSHSCDSLYNVDSVFDVVFEDSVFSEPSLIQLDERTWGWKRGTFIDGIV